MEVSVMLSFRRYPFSLVLLAAVVCPPPVVAQDVVSVDVLNPIADVSRRPVGINVNFLVDDDANRRQALATLADALRRAGVKYLRYPGGEKADGYLWSVPPFTSPVPTLARWAAGEWPQNGEWPSYDRALVQADGRTFRTDPLDFDEFMALCRAIDCVPTIVVCYDSMYKPAQPGGAAPSRPQLLDTAREWVRYANVTRGYNVRYWEIGNESYLDHYNGGATAAQYASDLVEFSRVMKNVDPTIQIGANGESDAWWAAVLPVAASSIDFLAIHNYPAYDWGSYAHYRDTTERFDAVLDAARHAIASSAPPQDRSRLRIAVTETGAADWSGGWPHRNDIGHALVLFEILGTHLADPEVEFTQLWNTRWVDNETVSTPSLFDALDRHNELQATGRVLAIWDEFLKPQLVGSTSTAMVRTYATASASAGTLTVFLVNKDTQARDVTARIDGLAPSMSVRTWVFTGAGPDDDHPVWLDRGTSGVQGGRVTTTLDPVSITVLDLAPTPSSGRHVPGKIEAEDFNAFFDTTSENSGGEYRPTPVDIARAFDDGGGYTVGWIDPGEWLEYVVEADHAGDFRLSARVATTVPWASMRVLVDDLPIGSPVQVPNTRDWQSWTTINTGSVSLSPGTHRVRMATDTGWFNVNWLSIDAADGDAGRPVPGTIEAEDFDAFFDTTVENSGGEYRSTPVDIAAASDDGGGYTVGWIFPGEWLEYEIAAATAGTYSVSLRVASPLDTTSVRLEIDGVPAGNAVAIPNTGDWQAWKTIPLSDVQLSPGTHRVRLATDTGWFNVNWMRVDGPNPPPAI
jgi:alpha-L-arabinofuranosidase